MMTIAEVRRRMLTKLAGSGLSAADARAAWITPMLSPPPAITFPPQRAPGFAIPYYGANAKPTGFYRYRYVDPVPQVRNGVGLKAVRYSQPSASGVAPYLTPGMPWKDIFRDVSIRLFLTEGELKALCACKLHIPAIGFGGVFNWEGLLDDIAWKERQTYIVFDSDAVTNPQVCMAENRLAKFLLDHEALPYIVRLPAPVGADAKTGLDDFLVAQGAEVFGALCEQTELWRVARELYRLNEEVAYLRNPGLLYRWATGHRFSAADFSAHQYSDRIMVIEVSMPQGGVRKTRTKAAAEWLKWPGRAVLERAVYRPGEERICMDGDARCLNDWRGWGCEPKRGNVELWHQLLKHLVPEERHRRTLEQWLAYPLQHPEDGKIMWAVLLWSLKPGVGKTTIDSVMRKIYGDANCSTVDEPQLSSEFNAWQAARQWYAVEEICLGGGRDRRNLANRMKPFITQSRVTVNSKYNQPYTIEDRGNWFLTSNQSDAMVIENEDRRYWVYETPGAPLPEEFYRKFHRWLDVDDGAAAVFYHLLGVDLTDFSAKGHAPTTNAKQEMIDANLGEAETWAREIRDNPDAALKVMGIPVPLTYLREKELEVMFRHTHPKIDLRIMRAALKKYGMGPLGQVRCGPWGKIHLRRVRPAPEDLTSAQIGQSMRSEREKWKAAPALFLSPKALAEQAKKEAEMREVRRRQTALLNGAPKPTGIAL